MSFVCATICHTKCIVPFRRIQRFTMTLSCSRLSCHRYVWRCYWSDLRIVSVMQTGLLLVRLRRFARAKHESALHVLDISNLWKHYIHWQTSYIIRSNKSFNTHVTLNSLIFCTVCYYTKDAARICIFNSDWLNRI